MSLPINPLIVFYYGPAILSHFKEIGVKPILSQATLILVKAGFPDFSFTCPR